MTNKKVIPDNLISIELKHGSCYFLEDIALTKGNPVLLKSEEELTDKKKFFIVKGLYLGFIQSNVDYLSIFKSIKDSNLREILALQLGVEDDKIYNEIKIEDKETVEEAQKKIENIEIEQKNAYFKKLEQEVNKVTTKVQDFVESSNLSKAELIYMLEYEKENKKRVIVMRYLENQIQKARG